MFHKEIQQAASYGDGTSTANTASTNLKWKTFIDSIRADFFWEQVDTHRHMLKSELCQLVSWNITLSEFKTFY